MKIQIKILDSRMSVPEYATPGSAAVDLRACLNCETTLPPGEQLLIGTGIAIHLNDPRYAAMILPRSGLGSKGLVLGNTIGLIDADYQGELKVCLWNRSSEVTHIINHFDRIAQLVITPVVQAKFDVVGEFSLESERGLGGFGSSGVA